MVAYLTSLLFHVTALVLLFTACPASAIDCSPVKKNNNTDLKKYCDGTRDGHVFLASAEEPLAASIRSIDDGESVRVLTNELKHLSQRARDNYLKEFKPTKCGDPTTDLFKMEQEITSDQRQWTHSSNKYFKPLNLPELESFCFSSVRIEDAEARRLITLISKFKITQKASITRAKAELSLLNKWPNVTSVASVPAEEDPNTVFKCMLSNVAAGRVANGGRGWALLSSFTSAPAAEELPDGKRHYVTEIIDTKGRAVQLKLYRENEILPGPIESSTLEARWGGVAFPTHFVTVKPPAMQDNDATMLSREVVYDTIAPSNIAILALPLFMSLVPISCIESVTTPIVFVYALLTDVLTALPLAVKGIELLIISSATDSVCEAWVSGVDSDIGTAAIEVWCAKCVSRGEFVTFGAVLLAVALFMLVIGIAVEVIARKRLLNHLKKNDGSSSSWWSMPILARFRARGRSAGYTQQSPTFCEECLCTHRTEMQRIVA